MRPHKKIKIYVMILGFKTELFEKPTNFIEKILLSSPNFRNKCITQKIHTIRKGNRFKGGEKLHMATGVRTKNYSQFNQNIKGLDICTSVQYIKILNYQYEGTRVLRIGLCDENFDLVYYWMNKREATELIMNDGFTGLLSIEDFWKYFNEDYFEGQIIHWTDKRY